MHYHVEEFEEDIKTRTYAEPPYFVVAISYGMLRKRESPLHIAYDSICMRKS